MTTTRKNWRLSGPSGDYEIVALDPTDSNAWPAIFEQAIANPDSRRTIAELLAFVSGHEINGASTNVPELRRMASVRLEEAFRRGQLRIIRTERGGGMSSSLEQAEALASQVRAIERSAAAARRDRQERTDKTWVEIELLTKRGKPVAGARYRLKLPDGSTRQGTLNTEGRVRVAGIDPGMCEVCFPDYDGGEWRPA